MTLILSGTNGVSDIDGSAATPAIRGTDANTGIFFPAADTIAFSEGGAEIARFDSSGNLGIGTSSPVTKLVIAGNNSLLAENNTLRFWDTDNATQTDQQVGKIEFYSSDATAPGPSVKAYMGAFADDSSPGVYLAFATDAETGTATEKMRIESSGNLQFNSGYGSVATAYGCRAWVNFNGTGTVAIRGSGNVTSITDSGVGLYDVNFTTAMPDANYAPVVTVYSTNSALYAIGGQVNAQAPTTAKFRIATGAGASLGADTTAGYADLPHIFATVFR